MMDHLIAFLAVATVVIVTPGPDTALTIGNTLLGGRRNGIFTALGVAAGQTTWTVASSAGLAALLVASEPVFHAVRLAGAAYLAFLGAQALRAALRLDRSRETTGLTELGKRLKPVSALRQGLISNLTNPKMVAFFPALLPQFAPEGRPIFASLLILGLVFSLMTLCWLTGYAVAIARAGDFMRRPRIRHVLQGMTGAVLIALGLRLAAEAG